MITEAEGKSEDARRRSLGYFLNGKAKSDFGLSRAALQLYKTVKYFEGKTFKRRTGSILPELQQPFMRGSTLQHLLYVVKTSYKMVAHILPLQLSASQIAVWKPLNFELETCFVCQVLFCWSTAQCY